MNRPAHGHVRAARPRTRPAGATTALTARRRVRPPQPRGPRPAGPFRLVLRRQGRHPAAPGPAPDCQQRHLRPHPA